MPNGVSETTGGQPRPSVWRFDTQTGALQVCFYSANVSITCFAPDYPEPGRFKIHIQSVRHYWLMGWDSAPEHTALLQRRKHMRAAGIPSPRA